MNVFFDDKFKTIIKTKTNREKILKYLTNHYHKKSNLYMIFYELYCEFQLQPSQEHLFDCLKHQNILYNHDAYSQIKSMVEEEDNFIIQPPILSEGIMTCKYCKSSKTLSYEKQTRSSDEQSTIFVKCLECHKSFRM